MKSGESVADCLSRATTIVSQMRSYGEKIVDQTIIEKVLRSLTPKFNHVVAVIEESKDLSIYSFDELMGSLQAHEARSTVHMKKNEEKAFQVKGPAARNGWSENSTYKGRGRGGFRGRGRGNGRGRGCYDGQRQSNEPRNNKSNVQCHHCQKFWHVQADCWYKDQQINFAAENGDEGKLFMAHCKANSQSRIVDNGCSNHMTGTKSMFTELDESKECRLN
ncbi:PREDICTED: uncharacterized protein LOC105949478 [Erythranthe guttata]|uniref:uncharacterized protein LOC105949478 n=1 Tax=Erythranthe guttata TaxID=4155 RepID=UPI00064DED6A|nr:PREDICTED: uncharacterized protein LOC105949478 [Erythranthe guttata]|eukprot:XP_012828244.1 PREDICTED: uncharacterized protein LOC105949478 [Erythranthe guttata]